MGHPATTNPFIIMIINMTVVFFVLIALSGLIHLIHLLDPTKEPETKSDESSEDDENAAIIAKLKEQQVAKVEEPQVEEGLKPEIVAAITAAISAYGFSGQVRAVRIVGRENNGWHRNALDNGLRKQL